MKKEIFNLRHAALVAALALAVSAPQSFADEVPVAIDPVVGGADLIATTPPPTDGAGPIVTDVVTIDPPALPVVSGEVLPGDTVAIDPPALPVISSEVLPEATPPVAGNEVVVEATPVDVASMDDCGVICQNVAGEPEPAVYKSEDVPPQVLQFGSNGELPDPAQNVSAELSGAIGVAEQLGATDVALGDAALVEPLTAAAPTAIVAKASGADSVSVIRNGHLR